MKSDELIPIDLNTAFKFAENTAKSKSPKAKFILDLIVNKNDRGYLNLCYAYLRWVDDFVDDVTHKNLDKIEFINRQKKLLRDFSLSQNETQLNIEEAFLFYFVRYAITNKKLYLIEAVKIMLESIEMDAQRLQGGGSYSNKEMNLYIDKNSKAFFDIMTGFVMPLNIYTPQNLYIGRFATRLFMLRDFADDFQQGFLNIPKEDLEYYEIEKTNLHNDKNLFVWVKNEFGRIINLLYDEALIVKTFPFKLKIFNYYSQIYYLPKIFRLKTAGFNPFIAANELSFVSITKVYLSTVLVCIKLFRIEFL